MTNEQQKTVEPSTQHNQLFNSYLLNQYGLNAAITISKEFGNLVSVLEPLCLTENAPVSREFAICKTKLEEACFFAKKAMASKPENQVKS